MVMCIRRSIRDATAEKFKQKTAPLLNRGDGQFFDLSGASGPGISDEHSSRGLAVGDLDNDGQLEIVIVNMDEPPSLLKNVAPRIGNSLLIRLVTPAWQRRNWSTSHFGFRGEEADRRRYAAEVRVHFSPTIFAFTSD